MVRTVTLLTFVVVGSSARALAAAPHDSVQGTLLLAGGLSKALGSQGWKSDGADLVTPISAILNLTRGDATLTIMIKPLGSGSHTTVFAEGLDWAKKK